VTLKVNASSTTPEKARVDLLAVAMYADRKPGPGAELGGKALVRFAEDAGFEAKLGTTIVSPAPAGIAAKSLLVVGLGKRDELTIDGLRRAGAAIARSARTVRSVATTLADAAPKHIDRLDVTAALVEGVVLGGYEFLRYKSDAKRSQLASLTLLGGTGARVQSSVDAALATANATCWARDLVNEPAAAKSPASFAAAATRLLRPRGVKVQVWSGAELTRRRLAGTVTVGMGSQRPPRFLRMEYAPAGARHTLALVGKGVVFDSGGLSLKTSAGMEQMKTDMGGAAAVIAAMSVLQHLGVRTRVVGYAPMVENMPSGNAYRLGDVITYRNGKTVEVMNTDAEGRLILADALALAADEKADAIINLATLTGACMVALGPAIAGLMGNNDDWIAQVRAAGDSAGEKLWHLPLPAEYRKLIDSEIADMKNTGGPYGGAVTAGLFLEEFVGSVPWVHLDIAGPARAESTSGYTPRGGTGFGVRTLVELVQGFRKPR
jgi:leucyl aminopeptidase